MTGKSVFIVGPGFIGWNVLDLLVKEQYQVTGYVRREEHGEAIKKSGATSVVLGDLNDKAIITEQTIKHDIIIHAATADHLPSVEAILDGIKERASQGYSTVFIHTSGTGVLDDGANGGFKTAKIYSDNERAGIDSVADTAPHRSIDLAIVRAQKELGDKARLAIMIPPLIYGFNPRHARLSIQMPTMTRFALKHGFVPHVGDGLAVESNIHVLDLARAYITLLHQLEKAPAAYSSQNPYFFCETTGDDEPSWKEVSEVIAQGLHRAGRLTEAKAGTVDQALSKDLFGDATGATIGLNSRSRARRLRELGWEPREKDWKSSFLEVELPEILKENLESFSGYTGVVQS